MSSFSIACTQCFCGWAIVIQYVPRGSVVSRAFVDPYGV